MVVVVSLAARHNISSLQLNCFRAVRTREARPRRSRTPDLANTILLPAGGGVDPPQLAGLAQVLLARLRDTQRSAIRPAVRNHQPSPVARSAHISLALSKPRPIHSTLLRAKKSFQDEIVRHKAVTSHVVIHFVQFVFESTPGASEAGSFKVTPHQEPFNTCFWPSRVAMYKRRLRLLWRQAAWEM
jgi:hypothetical protein